ncbi:hypothetical protein SLS55_009289 [Diplodia seriata]|uniref:Uncharacterized protein n=2 Tax=Diplodia TaxID=66735 RepID=A0A0G2FM56_9PEZI|nr:hypothetical protein UCDDS831_g09388 [Diplodia seriata]
MSPQDEKTTFGVTITRPLTPESESLHQPPNVPSAAEPALRSPPSTDSHLSAGAALASPTYRTNDPFSPFYQHPESRSHLEVDRSKNDLESGLLNVAPPNGVPLSAATTQTQPKVSIDGRVKECTVWPTKQTLQHKARAAKAQRRTCQCWGRLTKKQKIMVEVLIGLTVVALAVGLSVGISRAVGGGVWAGTGQSHTIPKDGS